MQMGMIGLGRMGASMVRRLMRGGHECVVYDVSADAVASVAREGVLGVSSLDALAAALKKPRVVWMMVPAAVVEQTVDDLSHRFERGDIIVDGGNSHYVDDICRARTLAAQGIHYVDAGTSGGVWGLERGFCQMIGGEPATVQHLDPLFAMLAPPVDSAPPTSGRDPASDGTATHGYLHCGPNGAGHFVKMVHNGIEYGIMAAYAESLTILRQANVGTQARVSDAETAPLRNPELYRYDLNLPDITEVSRRGSVMADIVASKQVIYDGFNAAIADHAVRDRVGSSSTRGSEPPFSATPRSAATSRAHPPRRAVRTSSTSSTATRSRTTSRKWTRRSPRCMFATTRKATRR
jgi:6-phosphogluconate dehydrogenase